MHRFWNLEIERYLLLCRQSRSFQFTSILRYSHLLLLNYVPYISKYYYRKHVNLKQEFIKIYKFFWIIFLRIFYRNPYLHLYQIWLGNWLLLSHKILILRLESPYIWTNYGWELTLLFLKDVLAFRWQSFGNHYGSIYLWEWGSRSILLWIHASLQDLRNIFCLLFWD